MQYNLNEILKLKIEQAIQDGFQHYTSMGERLDGVQSVMDAIMSYREVIAIPPPDRRCFAGIKPDKIDFACSLENLGMTIDGALWVPKCKGKA